MQLTKITLINFKNHGELSIDISGRLNGFIGPNGTGKTNLLEAIYYGLTGLPYFHRSDRYNIRKGEEEGAIRLDLTNGEDISITVRLQVAGKKVIAVNGTVLERITDHIGNYPAVMIAPGDIELITGGSEERRRFLDRNISLCDHHYLKTLTRYNRLLEQRNKQLKMFYDQRFYDEDLLHVIDMQLAPLSDEVFAVRKKYLKAFTPLFRSYYQKIEGGQESVDIFYASQLQEKGMNSSALLKANREADRFQQRTSAGVHKDDLEFELDQSPLKRYGSQGQIKTFLIAVNLASYDMIIRLTGKKPFLLLDDIFEKIDGIRAERLMKAISAGKFSQIFVTDTDRSRLEQATSFYKDDRQFTDLAQKETN